MKKILLPALTGLFLLTVLILSVSVYKNKVDDYSQDQSTTDDICGIDKGAVIKGIQADNSWGIAGLKGGASEIYLTLYNRSTESAVLTGASSNVSKNVEIHFSQTVVDGAMKMDILESIALPAKREVEFIPGSFHIMLINLTRDLKNGDKTLITLHFQNQGDLSVIVPIKDW